MILGCGKHLFGNTSGYRWLLWYSNEVDGLYVENGRFPSFASSEALVAYAGALGLVIDTVEAKRP